MAKRVNEFTPVSDIESGDTFLGIRTSNQDISLDLFAGVNTRAGALDIALKALIAGAIGSLRGLTLSRASATTIGIATGSVADSTSVDILALGSAYTKSLSAWAVGTGNGAMDAGAVANNTWYAVFIIKRVDTGVVDLLLSTSATAPTLPSNYTLFRRIGWILTNGSSQITQFNQVGRQFFWNTRVRDINAETPASTNRILKTISCPPNTEGMFIFWGTATGTATSFQFGWTALADAASTGANRDILVSDTAVQTVKSVVKRIPVDSSRQIFYRADATTGTAITGITEGWIDEL